MSSIHQRAPAASGHRQDPPDPDPGQAVAGQRTGPPRVIQIPAKRDLLDHFRRRRATLILGLGLLLLVAVLVTWLSADPVVDASRIILATVERGALDISITGQGELRSSDRYALAAPTAGTIRQVHAQPGARLAKGQKIVSITAPEMDRQLLDAKAALASEESRHAAMTYDLTERGLAQEDELAQANASAAADRLELNAMESLLSSYAISKIQYERQRLKTRASEERLLALKRNQQQFRSLLRRSLATSNELVAQRRQMLANLQERAEGLEVKAESAGVLLRLSEGVSEGQSTTPGQVLGEVARSDRLEAIVRVAASRAAEIRIGSHARLSASVARGTGSVVRIDPEASAAQVVVTIAIDDMSRRDLRPGLPVSVELPVGREVKGLYLARPRDARLESEGYVYVREDDALVRRKVRFGRGTTTSVIVEWGLKEGDDVVISGAEDFGATREVRLLGDLKSAAQPRS